MRVPAKRLLRMWLGLFSIATILGACTEGDPTGSDNLANRAAALEIVSGNEQSAGPSQQLPQPLLVRVIDSRGRTVQNQIVNFVVVSGGGSVFAGVSSTNSNGVAREIWTLGPDTLPQQVEARAVDRSTGAPIVFATFRATVSIATTPTGDTQAPSVPQSVVAQAASSTTVSVTWAASSDNVAVTGYRVYRNGAHVSTATTPSHTDNSLTASTSYTYAVSAIDAGGNESARSSVVSVTTPAAAPAADTQAPSVPQNLAGQAVDGNTVSLTWSAATDNVAVTGYRIFRDGAQVGTSTTASYSSGGLAAGTSYGFAVSAVDAAGNQSARSTVVNVATQSTVTPPPPPPPPSGGTSVDLKVVRLDGGSGTTLVSSGVPLVPGMLMPADVNKVRLFINNVEQPVYVEALSGRHKDGSVRSVLVQTSYSVGATPVSAQLLFGTARSTTDRTKVSQTFTYAAPMPTAVLLPTSMQHLIATGLIGPTLGTNSFNPTYEAKFVYHSDQKWALMQAEYGTTLSADAAIIRNYYDRALTHWVWWVRTGETKYYQRAIYYLMAYRERYMRPNNYNVQPHHSQIEGLELHYLLTGDEESLRGVRLAAEIFGDAWLSQIGDPLHTYMDNRIQGRILHSLLTAHRLGVTSRNFAALSRQALTMILGTQQPDGAYLWPAACGGQMNFMAGVLNEVLAEYYDTFEQDARILPAIKKSIDWTWSTQWLAADGAFKYVSLSCPAEGGPSPAPDLNHLIGYAFGWVYKMTGDATYRTRGDLIFNEGVTRAWLGDNAAQGDKQFNQMFRSSYQYLWLRN